MKAIPPKATRTCDECGSDYFAAQTRMAALCPSEPIGCTAIPTAPTA